jgi:peptidoglycan/LPS O-acetylase OafA/YrhL
MAGAASFRERLDFLDVARGLAALLVVLAHGLDVCLPNLPHSFPVRYADLGRSGVILFLIISGFIIPASLEQGGSNARFWLRRFFRLFPAYWVSIGVAYGCGWFSPAYVPLLTTRDWLLNLTMLQGFFARPHVWGVFWTLQLELIIYTTCSLLFASRLLARSSYLAGLALAGYAVVGLARPLLEGKPFDIGGQRLLWFAPMAGLLAQRYFVGRFGGRSLLAWGAVQVGSLATIWAVNHALFPSEITPACWRELASSWGVAYACFFLLLAARRQCFQPVACWLGRISYSVYLLHPFVLVTVYLANCPSWLFLPTFLGGTLLLAELTYRFVELPGIALGRIIERRWWPATSIPASAPLPSRRAA